MSVEKLTAALADGDPYEYGDEVFNSGWISNGKYDLIEIVIRVDTNKDDIETGYYRCTNSRTGSYYTDYDYDEWFVEKVEPYTETVVITKYRRVE